MRCVRRVRTFAPNSRAIETPAQVPRPLCNIEARMTSTAARSRVMSGMRPTGDLHLGHLVGVLTQWANYCDTADAFFEIADLHAYTTDFDDPGKVRAARE